MGDGIFGEGRGEDMMKKLYCFTRSGFIICITQTVR